MEQLSTVVKLEQDIEIKVLWYVEWIIFFGHNLHELSNDVDMAIHSLG